MVVIAGVIAASAATVIVAFGSLLSAQFGLYRSMGPGLAISIAITLVAGLTLTPAILHVLKVHAFWPRSIDATRQRAEHDHPRWRRIGDAVGRRPAVALLAAAVPLLIASAGLLDMRQSFDLVNDLPPSADAREGFASLDGHLPEGRLSPIFLIIDAPAEVSDDPDFQAIADVTTALADAPGVGEVRSITSPAGGPLTTDTLDDLLPGGTDELFADIDPSDPAVAEAIQQLDTPEGLRITPALLDAVPAAADVLEPFLLGADRSSPRVVVSLDGNPYSPDALSDFRRLDDITRDALRGTSLADSTIEVAGPTSFYSDIQEVGTRDFRVMSATLVIGIFIVLALLLRSLVAPFYLLATVVLSYTATLGITVFVFRTVLGQEGITFWMPPFLFVILVALGADYNIFVMSRIREEAALGAPADEAAVRGLVATGRVITSAGLVLAGTFAALIAAPLPNLQQIGFAVTLGVLIDTFIVRTCLVPAITALIGDTAFWPSGGRASTRRGALIQGAAVTLGVIALVAVAGTVIAANR
jgi:RND superfamily putative drug exporter